MSTCGCFAGCKLKNANWRTLCLQYLVKITIRRPNTFYLLLQTFLNLSVLSMILTKRCRGWAYMPATPLADLPKASSGATRFLSKIIVHEQVITAPGSGAVAVTCSPAGMMNCKRSVVHPGGDRRQRLCSRFMWKTNQVSVARLSLSVSLSPSPSGFFCVLEKECILLGPTTLFLTWRIELYRCGRKLRVATEQAQSYYWCRVIFVSAVSPSPSSLSLILLSISRGNKGGFVIKIIGVKKWSILMI